MNFFFSKNILKFRAFLSRATFSNWIFCFVQNRICNERRKWKWTYGLIFGFELSSLSDLSASLDASSLSVSLATSPGLFGDEWLLKLLSASFSLPSAASFSVSYSVEPFSVVSFLFESFSFLNQRTSWKTQNYFN